MLEGSVIYKTFSDAALLRNLKTERFDCCQRRPVTNKFPDFDKIKEFPTLKFLFFPDHGNPVCYIRNLKALLKKSELLGLIDGVINPYLSVLK